MPILPTAIAQYNNMKFLHAIFCPRHPDTFISTCHVGVVLLQITHLYFSWIRVPSQIDKCFKERCIHNKLHILEGCRLRWDLQKMKRPVFGAWRQPISFTAPLWMFRTLFLIYSKWKSHSGSLPSNEDIGFFLAFL